MSPHLLFLFHTNLYQLYIHTIFSLFCTTREHNFSQSQSLNSKWHLFVCLDLFQGTRWFCEDCSLAPRGFPLVGSRDSKGTSWVGKPALEAGEALWPETSWTEMRQCCNRLSCRNSGIPWPPLFRSVWSMTCLWCTPQYSLSNHSLGSREFYPQQFGWFFCRRSLLMCLECLWPRRRCRRCTWPCSPGRCERHLTTAGRNQPTPLWSCRTPPRTGGRTENCTPNT